MQTVAMAPTSKGFLSERHNDNTLLVRVGKKTVEAQDIYGYELFAVDDKPLPSFTAGSHINVHIADGTTRQYSLCNPPHENHRYQIAVLRDPKSRGGSIAMHDHIGLGDVIKISPPKNHFALDHDASHHVLIAGGIGVTPILCMAERLSTIGASFEMHYSCRSEERTAFRQRLIGSTFADKVQFHFDDKPDHQKLDLQAALASFNHGTHLYVCGPSGFIDHVVSTAQNIGLKSAQIHFEHFGAKEQDTSHDQSFEIKIASTGAVFVIPPDKSITHVLSENGIDLPVSCEQGACGTCITRVLSGTPDHRDVYFSEEEQARNDQFTPCCSRAKSPQLVLAL